jgi:hypothetical protein
LAKKPAPIDGEAMILLWQEFADRWAEAEPQKAARFRRLANQMRHIVATSEVSWDAPPRTVDLRVPPPKPPAMPKRRYRRRAALNSDTLRPP